MADSFQGPVRVLGGDGILLTTGSANLVIDDEMGGWKGTLETLRGTAVAGKALVVELEIPGNGTGPRSAHPQRSQWRSSRLRGGQPRPTLLLIISFLEFWMEPPPIARSLGPGSSVNRSMP